MAFKYCLLFRTLDSLIQQNEDVDKTITYLKMDVEGYELDCFENWFNTNVLDNVEQFGIEIHLSNKMVPKNQIKLTFSNLNKVLLRLLNDYGFYMVDSEPNRCIEKREDGQKIYYSYNDVLFVKNNEINL